MMGPRPIPSPIMPAQAAIARPRSSLGKTLMRIESVEGIIIAAPNPMTARAAMSWVAVVTSVAAIEPAPKTSSPACRRRARPNRSPIAPMVSSNPANTRM